MYAGDVKQRLEAELNRLDRFSNWHGISPENITSHVVEPYEVNVDPDDLESPARRMWVVLHENPAKPELGYVVVFDPSELKWGVAEHVAEANFVLVISAETLVSALEGM